MTYLLAVVGKNIHYSKSPFIHSAFGQALGISVDYSIQDVLELTFQQKIAQLQEAGFFGCNITVPFKEEAFAMADEVSPRAKAAGAANTFRFDSGGSICADNTDGSGFIRDVTRNIGVSLTGKRILICGAGGAIRGILGPLMDEAPSELVIANRTLHKNFAIPVSAVIPAASVIPTASVIPAQAGIQTYESLTHQTFDVVIDGTSLKTESLPLPASLTLSRDALVYDLKYSPGAPTSIMQWAKTKGAKHIHDGIGMLVEQAAEAFYFWTGERPETSLVLAALKATTS